MRTTPLLPYGFSSENDPTFARQPLIFYLNTRDWGNHRAAVFPNVLFMTNVTESALQWDALCSTYLNKTLTLEKSKAACFPTEAFLDKIESAWVYVPDPQQMTGSVTLPFQRSHTTGWMTSTFWATNILSTPTTGLTGSDLDDAIAAIVTELCLVKTIDMKRLLSDGGLQEIDLPDAAIHVHVDEIPDKGLTTQTFSVTQGKAKTRILSSGWKTTVDYEIPYLVVFEINKDADQTTATMGFEMSLLVQDSS